MSESSVPQSVADRLRQASQQILSESTVVTTVKTGATRFGRYVRGSFLYRWLTKEPDPEVIVIDLRDTWTVGPILAVLERVLTALDRARAGSRIGSLLKATTTALRATPVRNIGIVVAAVGAMVTIATLLTSGTTTSVVIGLAILLVGVIATRDNRDWETLRETQAAALLRRVLEPPAPPADVDNRSAGNETNDEDQSPDGDTSN